jgi:fructose-1,6-bisphosphatase/sedoheptulose 1,7-bisphosphatase-like protein
VRAAAAHRHAEALRAADGDVGADLARRHDQRQRQQVGRDDERRLVRVHARGVGAQVVDRAVGGGQYCASTAK